MNLKMRCIGILPLVVLALASATSAQAGYKLTVTKPIAGHVYHPGEAILVEAKPPQGVTPQSWKVKWEITCTSCGNPPTYASVFVQDNLLSPPGGYDVTNVLGFDTKYSYCARVIMYPDQPGWDWSDKVCFTTTDNSLRAIDPHKLTKPPVFTKDPGPIRPQTNLGK